MYSSNFKNIFINTLFNPLVLNFLIAILFFLIDKSLNKIPAIVSFKVVSICISEIISSISSLINLTASISIALPPQFIVNC